MSSPGSSASPRLLANLLTHEKDYAKTLGHVLDAGGAACTALLLYQPWLNNDPPRGGSGEETDGHSIIHSLAHADAGLHTYAAAIETYIDSLKELRDLEEGVRNLVRDREILVTRVLKTSNKSNNKSSNRDSIFSASSPTHSTVSLDSLNGKYTLGNKSPKLVHWQSELHGCESQLASAQRQLESKRISAIRDGLRLRATAMVECGTRWIEAGKSILQLETDGLPLPPLPQHAMDKPLPDDASSLTPSQSASQLGPDVDMHIPPAHSIADMGIPTSHVLPRRITEEDLGASSSSDEEEVAVVENPRFGSGSKRATAHPSSSSNRRQDDSPTKSRFFGSLRSFFGSKKTTSSVDDDGDDVEEQPPRVRKASTWDTRTDKNLRKVDPVVIAGSPSGSAVDVTTIRARRLQKNTPEKRQRRRSASLDGVSGTPAATDSKVWDGSAPLPRKRSTKKKRAGGEASPSSGLSRSSSITSAPATYSPRSASPPPPLPSGPSHKRQSSLSSQPSGTNRTERRASSPPIQTSSLMSIVEDVARANRQATLESGNSRERTLSGGLVSVKAPHSFTKKEIDGMPLECFVPPTRERTTSTSSKPKANHVSTLFDVKAPASPTREHIEGLPSGSFVVASSSSSSHHLPTSNGVHHPTHLNTTLAPPAPSSSSGSSPPGSSASTSRPPLRGVLRNGGSRTPSPMGSIDRPPPSMFVVQAPSPLYADGSIPSLPTTPRVPSPLKAKQAVSPYDDDDTASIASMSSYETTHEMFDEEPESVEHAPSSPAPPAPPEKEYVTLSQLDSSPYHEPPHARNGTDISASSDSTVNNASTPKRRKSVRVSLRPTFSPTPPAIEYDEWHPSENTVIDETAANSSNGNGNAKKHSWKSKDEDEPADMWQDSSDEDEQYSTARKLLTRVARKEKKTKGR